MRWMIPALAIALAGAILLGSLGFEDVTRERTVYEPVTSDLTPIASYTPVTEDAIYNPQTNTVGWSGATYQTQLTPSLYYYYTGYTYTPQTSSTLESYGKYILYPTGELATDWKWSDSSIVRDTPPSGTLIGGWHGSMVITDGDQTGTFTSTIDVLINDGETEWSLGSCAILLTGAVSGIGEGTVVELDSEPGVGDAAIVLINTWAGRDSYRYSWYFDETGTDGHFYDRFSVTWHMGYAHDYDMQSGEVIYSEGAWYRVTGYDSLTGEPQVDKSTAYAVAAVGSGLDTFAYSTQSRSDPVYVAPYSLATVAAGDTATWRNGYSNNRVQFVADATGMTFSVNGAALTDYALADRFLDMETWATNYTGKVLVTVDGDSGRTYWQGVTSYADTRTYTVADYQYDLTVPGTTVTAGTAITSITVGYTGTAGNVGITNTWMPLDSMGKLWNNADFNIAGYFATVWASHSVRVTLDSFVKTGSSLVVDGQTFPVNDGMLTVGEATFPVTGSSVEWSIDGETAIVAPNGDRHVIADSRTGDVGLGGAWYGVLGLDTIQQQTYSSTNLTLGNHATDSWRSWVFLALVNLAAIALLGMGKEFDLADWGLLGISEIIGLFLAVGL